MASKVKTEMLKTTDFHVIDNEILVKAWGEGKLEKYTKAVDFKKWYVEHAFVLNDNKVINFLDMLGEDHKKAVGDFFDYQVKKGEKIDPGTLFNRAAAQYEIRFSWNLLVPGIYEIEIEWYARAPLNTGKIGYSGFGWLEYRLELVCRRMVEKEVLEGNQKKVLQEGAWEFRNRFYYKNNIIPKLLNNIPIVRNSATMKALLIKYWFLRGMNKDLETIERQVKPIPEDHIRKYFT